MTHFSWAIDGSIIGLYLLATMIAGLMVRRYVTKVDDFLVAGREMNLYLGIASLAATEFGIITCMYAAENGYKYGFAGATPGILYAMPMLIVGWTGFCIKPLRDSNAITVPELLDRRFGARIRWLAGVVIVLGGLLNTGVFLRAGGDFLRLVCDFSPTFSIGSFEIESIVVVMTVLLIGVATYTILGGMLSVLITDFLQFIVMSLGLIAVTVLILADIGWDRLVATVEEHYHAAGFNPFVNPKLGWSWVVFNLLTNTAAVLTWQTAVARACRQGQQHRREGVYENLVLLCLPLPNPRHLGHRRPCGPRLRYPRRQHAARYAQVFGRLRARGAHGHFGCRDAGRRYEHRLLVHAYLG